VAKKSRQQRKAKAAQPPVEPSVNATNAVEAAPLPSAQATTRAGNEPPFWFGFAVSWPKLVTFRFTLLMVLALDAVLQISHAPRYGAGGFNVGHVRWLSGLAPARTLFEIAQLLTALCLVAAAVGAATRIMLPIAAALYAWIYFSSQLDSYQHHYLVALMLGLLCFVDWQRPADQRSATRPVGGWPLRLLLVQLAIMYFWAAISKVDRAWLDGATLSLQIHGSMRSAIEHTVGFGVAAKIVLLVELALAATVFYRPGWWVALPMGVALHLGIVWSGLEIGLFAWLMLVLYLLLVPDRVFTWGARKLQPLRQVTAHVTIPSARGWALMAAGLGLGLGLAAFTRYPHAMIAIALGGALLTIANFVDGRRRNHTAIVALCAPALATGLWLGVDRTTSTMYDYYRFWAGTESRIGDPARAKALYREVTERFPRQENGYYQLAKLEIASGSADDKQQAAAHLQRAQQLAPHLARAFVAEAKLLLSQGDRAAALAKAQAGAAAEPTSVDALTLVRQLQAMAPEAAAMPGAAAPTMPGKRPILDIDDDR